MKFLSLLLIIFCVSCTSQERMEVIESTYSADRIEIVEIARGAYSSNSYELFFRSENGGRERIYSAYSGSKPQIEWNSRDRLTIISCCQDRYELEKRIQVSNRTIIIDYVDRPQPDPS